MRYRIEIVKPIYTTKFIEGYIGDFNSDKEAREFGDEIVNREGYFDVKVLVKLDG